MASTEIEYCPACGVSLDAGDVYEKLRKNSPEESDAKILEWAEGFGWRPDHRVRFSRMLAHCSREVDRCIGYQCPDCHHYWERKD